MADRNQISEKTFEDAVIIKTCSQIIIVFQYKSNFF